MYKYIIIRINSVPYRSVPLTEFRTPFRTVTKPIRRTAALRRSTCERCDARVVNMTANMFGNMFVNTCLQVIVYPRIKTIHIYIFIL